MKTTVKYNLHIGETIAKKTIELNLNEGTRKDEVKRLIRMEESNNIQADTKFAVSKVRIGGDRAPSAITEAPIVQPKLIMGVDTLIKKLKTLNISPKNPLKGKGFKRVMLENQALAPLIEKICPQQICILSVQMRGGNFWRAKNLYHVSPELAKLIGQCHPDMIAGLGKSIENWATLNELFGV